MFALIVSAFVGANAQIATENSKTFDNVSLGVFGGVSTPLDFNSVFPLNTNIGIKLQKDFTPTIGIRLEGLAVLNDNHFSDIKTFVKATNVGLNGVVNLSNLFAGYKGAPRVFEVSAVGGLGWLYSWNTSNHNLSSKTGLDLSFNLGKKKASSIVLSPVVYWNLSANGPIQFNKKNAQLGVEVSYVYHFKTSNGTRHFKTWDVGAMIDEINRLQNAELKTANAEPKKANDYIDSSIEVKDTIVIGGEWFVKFAKNSAELTSDAKNVLDSIKTNLEVDVKGEASPEGSKEYNQKLSEQRANGVADYLRNRGIKVRNVDGVGAVNDASNRIVTVTVVK